MIPFYVKLEGRKQGAFKGESKRKGRENAVEGLAFSMEALSPRDATSGQASGKRQYKPIRFTKAWGAASPQILTALATNEILNSVEFDFIRIDGVGVEFVFQTVRLVNATVVDFRRFHDLSLGTPASTDGYLEEVSLSVERIFLEDNDGKTTFSDELTVVT